MVRTPCKLPLHFPVTVQISFSVPLRFLHRVCHSRPYCNILDSASSLSMTSAGPAIFFIIGILSSFSSCMVLVSFSFCSSAVNSSRSNCSCWHKTPMSLGGARNVYTLPVLRSNSKFDVLKNSLNGGQLNSILPFVVSIGSLSLIRLPTLVLRKSGTYQSRVMVPCCRTTP